MIAAATEQQSHLDWYDRTRLSRLALGSLVFAISGPAFITILWLISKLPFNVIALAGPMFTSLFYCLFTWLFGLILGTKALQQIDESQGRLSGKHIALASIIISIGWMLWLLVGLIMPALHSVNS